MLSAELWGYFIYFWSIEGLCFIISAFQKGRCRIHFVHFLCFCRNAPCNQGFETFGALLKCVRGCSPRNAAATTPELWPRWFRGLRNKKRTRQNLGAKQLERKSLTSLNSVKDNAPGTCDSPNKLFSHRRDLLLSNTALAALSLSYSRVYGTHRNTGAGSAGAHGRRFEK